jgi:pilus assembly protein Flp/PilA
MFKLVRKLWRDEEGPTAVEYALLLVLVALAIAGITPGLRNAITTVYQSVVTSLTPGG